MISIQLVILSADARLFGTKSQRGLHPGGHDQPVPGTVRLLQKDKRLNCTIFHAFPQNSRVTFRLSQPFNYNHFNICLTV